MMASMASVGTAERILKLWENASAYLLNQGRVIRIPAEIPNNDAVVPEAITMITFCLSK
jgi:hypothetical protein